MLKAVIFDMDGVLVDSEPAYTKEVGDFLLSCGIHISQQELFSMIGVSNDRFEGLLVEFFRKGNDVTTPAKYIIKAFDEYAKERDINYADLINPGVMELMVFLKSQGLKIAVASSSSKSLIKKVFMETGIGSYVDIAVSGDEFEKSKPEPEIYNHTVKLLGVDKDECFVVEDSYYGILAAKRAGLYVVAKRETRFDIDQSQACGYIDRMDEVISIVKQGGF